MNHLGFVKLRRSELLMELCQDPPAIAFLILAGMRAKWSDGPSVHGLEKGEAMMGDFEAYGATRAIHRRVISLLEKLQILTIKTTNKGTVVKFTDSTIFEFINMVEQPTKQPDNSQRTANEQPASNQQTTTNEEGKNSKKGKKEKILSEKGLSFADWFKTLLPADQKPTSNWRESWAEVYDSMVGLDGRSPKEIGDVCKWARVDIFWATQFFSPLKLRQRDKNGVLFFDLFKAKMNSNGNGTNGHSKPQPQILSHDRPKYPPPPSREQYMNDGNGTNGNHPTTTTP